MLEQKWLFFGTRIKKEVKKKDSTKKKRIWNKNEKKTHLFFLNSDKKQIKKWSSTMTVKTRHEKKTREELRQKRMKKKTGLSKKKWFLELLRCIFFSVVSFAQTSFPLPQKSSCFLISFFDTLFWKFVCGFLPKRPFKSSSFFFSEKIKMFLKNLVEKLCSVFSLLLLFLFSLFSCVFLFKKK